MKALAIVATLVPLLVALAMGFGAPTHLIAALSLSLVAIWLTVVSLALGARVISLAARLLARMGMLFGGDAFDRMFGTLLTVPFFLDAIASSIVRSARFFVLLCTLVPSHFADLWVKADSLCQTETIARCLAFASLGTLRVTSVIDEAIGRSSVDTLPFGSLILLTVLCAGLGQVSRVFRASAAASREVPQASETSLIWRSLILAAVMIFGAFLTVAAVVAIPVVEAPVIGSADDASAFEKEVGEVVPSSVKLEREFPSELLVPPARATTGSLKDSVTAAPPASPSEDADGGVTPAPAAARQSRSDAVHAGAASTSIEAFYGMARSHWVSVWTEVRSDTLLQFTRLESTLRVDFAVSQVNLKTDRERIEYRARLKGWAQLRAGALQQALLKCKESILNADQKLRALQPEPTATQVDQLLIIPNVRLDCNRPEDASVDAPQRGGELGPFGVVARWLILTDSLALALVTGLIGCGFLGSAVSTFLRRRIVTAQAFGSTATVASDVLSVVVRGLSAAFVTFLAAKGGLAIVASGGAQPNPYVLLLGCLLSAVYSERVWIWAERTLLAGIVGNDRTETAASDDRSGGAKTGTPPTTAQQAAADPNSDPDPNAAPRD